VKVFSFFLCTLVACAAFAQTPDVKIGTTIFADYTQTDAATPPDAFNVSRAYINIMGNLNDRISFRVTPDVARETGSGSSLSGSQTFRLKYAFAQFALNKSTWLRAGVQQTPLIDYEEGIYRYRFQGTTFVEREGFLTSSDAGISAHLSGLGDRAEVHAGYYNGEGYAHTETNDEKALQIRGTWRWSKSVRTTLFVDEDHYAATAKRQRFVGEVTYESARGNAGVDVLRADDKGVSSNGWSAWATPRLVNGWELLLRHDSVASQDHERTIAGIAYWMLNKGKLQSAVMLDYDRAKGTETRYGLKMMVAF